MDTRYKRSCHLLGSPVRFERLSNHDELFPLGSVHDNPLRTLQQRSHPSQTHPHQNNKHRRRPYSNMFVNLGLSSMSIKDTYLELNFDCVLLAVGALSWSFSVPVEMETRNHSHDTKRCVCVESRDTDYVIMVNILSFIVWSRFQCMHFIRRYLVLKIVVCVDALVIRFVLQKRTLINMSCWYILRL